MSTATEQRYISMNNSSALQPHNRFNTEYGEPIYYYFGNASITIENMDNIERLIVANSTNITIRNMTMEQGRHNIGFVIGIQQ